MFPRDTKELGRVKISPNPLPAALTQKVRQSTLIDADFAVCVVDRGTDDSCDLVTLISSEIP